MAPRKQSVVLLDEAALLQSWKKHSSRRKRHTQEEYLGYSTADSSASRRTSYRRNTSRRNNYIIEDEAKSESSSSSVILLDELRLEHALKMKRRRPRDQIDHWLGPRQYARVGMDGSVASLSIGPKGPIPLLSSKPIKPPPAFQDTNSQQALATVVGETDSESMQPSSIRVVRTSSPQQASGVPIHPTENRQGGSFDTVENHAEKASSSRQTQRISSFDYESRIPTRRPTKVSSEMLHIPAKKETVQEDTTTAAREKARMNNTSGYKDAEVNRSDQQSSSLDTRASNASFNISRRKFENPGKAIENSTKPPAELPKRSSIQMRIKQFEQFSASMSSLPSQSAQMVESRHKSQHLATTAQLNEREHVYEHDQENNTNSDDRKHSIRTYTTLGNQQDQESFNGAETSFTGSELRQTRHIGETLASINSQAMHQSESIPQNLRQNSGTVSWSDDTVSTLDDPSVIISTRNLGSVSAPSRLSSASSPSQPRVVYSSTVPFATISCLESNGNVTQEQMDQCAENLGGVASVARTTAFFFNYVTSDRELGPFFAEIDAEIIQSFRDEFIILANIEVPKSFDESMKGLLHHHCSLLEKGANVQCIVAAWESAVESSWMEHSMDDTRQQIVGPSRAIFNLKAMERHFAMYMKAQRATARTAGTEENENENLGQSGSDIENDEKIPMKRRGMFGWFAGKRNR